LARTNDYGFMISAARSLHEGGAFVTVASAFSLPLAY